MKAIAAYSRRAGHVMCRGSGSEYKWWRKEYFSTISGHLGADGKLPWRLGQGPSLSQTGHPLIPEDSWGQRLMIRLARMLWSGGPCRFAIICRSRTGCREGELPEGGFSQLTRE